MSPRRVAMLSLHTSPLAQPGLGDGGGMNVYVRSLAVALARAGVDCDLLTRADRPGVPPVVRVERGVRVVHLDAGPRAPVPKSELLVHHDELVDAAARWIGGPGGADVLHANYYASGAVAHTLKHRLGIPMVTTFHTLARAKQDVGIHDDPADRCAIEAAIVRCADGLVVSTEAERALLVDHYDAVHERVEVIPPGVDHSVFTPGRAARVRRQWRVGDDPVLLVVGRIQPLKGVDLAVRTLAALDDPRAHLVVVGGPSGDDGEAELARLHGLVAELGLGDRVRFEPARAHDALAAYYRAADVVLVPSRTESFGLVALEAAACGTPVVATSVGGLRSVVDHGASGYLVDDRDPDAFAAYVRKILDDRAHAQVMGDQASAGAHRYTWSIAAARLRRLYADVPRAARAVHVDDLEHRRAAAHALLARHLEGPVADEPWVQHVEHDPEIPRWYVRFGCDGRDAATIYFDLHQRSLHYEVYFLPEPPPETRLACYEFLLARNHALYGARFSIGPDGDLYLAGRVALEHLDETELDRVVGVLYEATERWFPPLVRLAFPQRSRPDPD